MAVRSRRKKEKTRTVTCILLSHLLSKIRVAETAKDPGRPVKEKENPAKRAKTGSDFGDVASVGVTLKTVPGQALLLFSSLELLRMCWLGLNALLQGPRVDQFHWEQLFGGAP